MTGYGIQEGDKDAGNPVSCKDPNVNVNPSGQLWSCFILGHDHHPMEFLRE